MYISIKNDAEIKLGTPATVSGWSDRYAGTITRIFNVGKSQYIVVTQDKATPAEGHDYYGEQKYDYELDPNGRQWTFRVSYINGPKGEQVPCQQAVTYNSETKRWNQLDCTYGLTIGVRVKHEDPHF
jgi:hypothetical protein